MNDIPVFVINLPHSTDRKIFMKEQCESISISPVFVEAINGRNISEADISQYCDQAKAKRLFGRELLLGEIGCALSHKKIYQKMVDESIPYAIILEDDANLEIFFSTIVKKIMVGPLSWELILLGHYKNNLTSLKSPISLWDKHSITSGFTLGRLADFGFGTHGYMITLGGAKKLVVELDNIHKPIDHYTSDSNTIKVYALSPTVVNVNDDFDTLIDDSEIRSFGRERSVVKILEKTHVINTLRKARGLFRVIKPVKKYK